MSTPAVPSHAFHDRFLVPQNTDGEAAHPAPNAVLYHSSAEPHRETAASAATAPATDSALATALPEFPEFKGFGSDQELFQSNYFEQFAPKITTPIASFEPQSALIENSSPEPAEPSHLVEQELPPVSSLHYNPPAVSQESAPASESAAVPMPDHELATSVEPFPQDQLPNGSAPQQPPLSDPEPHFSSASSYVSPPSIHQQLPVHQSPPIQQLPIPQSPPVQRHPNAGNPLPIPPSLPTSPPSSAYHAGSSPPAAPQPPSLNGHFAESSPLQAPFVFPPRPTTDSIHSSQPSSDHRPHPTHPDALPIESMRVSESEHVQPPSTNPFRNETGSHSRSSSFFDNERPSAAISASGQQIPVPRSMISDDDGFYQHHEPALLSNPSSGFSPNGMHQPQPRRAESNLPSVPRPSSFFGGDDDDVFNAPSDFSPTPAAEDETASISQPYQRNESVYRGISTAAGGTGNGPMPAAAGSGFGNLGSSTSTRPASIAPSTTSGPLLDHSHLKVGQKASLLSHGKTLELYRQNAKKTNDPNLIYELAVFMIDAAKTIEDEVPTGATPGPAAKVESQKEELIKEATGLLKKIADRGHPDGQYFLGDCYANGVGTKTGKQDFSQAYTYFVLAAKHGHPDAAYRAGTCYEKGWGCRKDAGKALQFFRKAAAQSHPGAMYRLATAELNGELGLKKNAKEGVKWLKRSAETATPEFPHALHELALLHERGIDNVLFVDPEYSCELLAQAGEMGYAPSAYKLGVNYEYGRMGCPQDGGLSIHMYNIAAQQNHKEACFALTAWYLVGAPGILPQSDTEAYLWAKKAAEQQLAKAEYAVGYFTEMGIGTVKDIAEAKAWYKRAADHGDKRASQRVAALQGRGAAPPPPGINRQQQRLEQRQEQRDSMLEFGRRGQPTSAPFPGSFSQSSMTPSTMTNYPSPMAMRDAQTAMREQQYLANVAANERAHARAMLRHSPSQGELGSSNPPAAAGPLAPAPGQAPPFKGLPRPPVLHHQLGHPPAQQTYPSYPSAGDGGAGAVTYADAPPPGPVGHVTMQPPPHGTGTGGTGDYINVPLAAQPPTTAGGGGDDKKKKKNWFARS